jgi:hypothetical protein
MPAPILFGMFCLPVSSLKTCKITILPVILYGYDTWSPTLNEKLRLRLFENRVQRRIFGLKREEVAGGWRRLHNEELHNFTFHQILLR